MFFESLKDTLSQAADYSRHNMFLSMGLLDIRQNGRRMNIRHSPLQAAFMIVMTLVFGPVLGLAVAMGMLDMTDAPVWAMAIAVIVPAGATLWLVHVLRTQVFSYPECVLDADNRRIRLNSPATREYYPGKKWPESLAVHDIQDVEILTQSASEGGDVYVLHIYRADDDFLILLATQNREKMQQIADFLHDKMGVRPAA